MNFGIMFVLVMAVILLANAPTARELMSEGYHSGVANLVSTISIIGVWVCVFQLVGLEGTKLFTSPFVAGAILFGRVPTMIVNSILKPYVVYDEEIGNFLRTSRHRCEVGYTPTQLAHLLYVDRSMLESWENGNLTSMRGYEPYLAKYLGIDEMELRTSVLNAQLRNETKGVN